MSNEEEKSYQIPEPSDKFSDQNGHDEIRSVTSSILLNHDYPKRLASSQQLWKSHYSNLSQNQQI